MPSTAQDNSKRHAKEMGFLLLLLAGTCLAGPSRCHNGGASFKLLKIIEN